MAYGEHFLIPFNNNEQKDCEVKLLSKDYEGYPFTLTGGDRPFTRSSAAQDNQVPYGIKATEAIIEFYAGWVTLNDFYSEDDTFWKVEFYIEDELKWAGFLQLDNCYDIFTDIDHIISLNANDGVASLQNVYLLEQQGDLSVPLYRHWLLQDLFSYIFGFLGTFLDIDAYLNIFENSTNDRTVNDTDDFIKQTAIDTKYYINSDGTTLSLYEILNNILIDFRSVMFQAEGKWNIVRWGDVRLFADGAMPGTRYLDGYFTTYEACTYPASIDIGKGLPIHPINENQRTRILRPYQFVKDTLMYNQPAFITQADLQIENGAIPFATNTIDGLVYDDYDFDPYFPYWKHINEDSSYLEIVTDDTTDAEVDRYIVTPCCTTVQSGVQIMEQAVSQNDTFDFSLSWRTDVDTDDVLHFWLRIVLITETQYYGLIALPDPDLPWVRWGTPGDIVNYPTDDSAGFILFQDVSNAADIDTTEWFSNSLSAHMEPNGKLPLIPEDGILLIQVCGTNGNVSTNTQGTFWKDANIDFSQFINSSSRVTGHYHNNQQTNDAKNNFQLQLTHDDSPRNSITGTLFTDASTVFEADIGGVYFTKTQAWHRSDFVESKKLGELNTLNDLFNQRKVRTILEGDFYGVTGVSLLSVVKFTSIPDKNFIFGIDRVDYKSCIWNATFYELFEDGEDDGDLDNTYTFNYIYDNG